MPIEISGPWSRGYVIDYHSISSRMVGHNDFGRPIFETQRTEIGSLMYQLKYQRDSTILPHIVAIVQASIPGTWNFDAIIPIPPSDKSRTDQPVMLIAQALSAAYSLPLLNILNKESFSQVKNVETREQRIEILRNSMKIEAKYDLSGKSLLLIDDLYDTGSTLCVASQILLDYYGSSNVCALAMTKTRR